MQNSNTRPAEKEAPAAPDTVSITMAAYARTPLRTPDRKPHVITGTCIVQGTAIGLAHHYRDMLSREFEQTEIEADQVNEEIARIENARQKAADELATLERQVSNRLGQANAGIFRAQRLMVQDPHLMRDLSSEIERRMMTAEAAIRDYFRRIAHRLRVVDNELIRRQAEDYRDVGRILLRLLTGFEDSLLGFYKKPLIVISRRLLPTDAIRFSSYNVRGIVTEECGVNSHSAILARELGIPCLSGISSDKTLISDGAPLILNAEKSELIIGPTRAQVTHFQQQARTAYKTIRTLARTTRNLHLSWNNQPITIEANVASVAEVHQAQSFGMDGIGLYRMEALYMLRDQEPDEEELMEALGQSLEFCGNRRATIRLLDAGGEKNLSWLDRDPPHDTTLGLRGIRLLLRQPSLLRSQINACLRLATRHPLRLLIPLVTTPHDILQTKQCIAEQISALQNAGIPCNDTMSVGAMIETPASLLSLEHIIQHVDFVAFGTNDLIQYLMAADRQNNDVAQYYDAGNDLVIQLLGDAVRKLRAASFDFSLCGELAGDLRYTGKLLHMGLCSFSVAPSIIPSLKAHIQELIEQQERVQNATYDI